MAWLHLYILDCGPFVKISFSDTCEEHNSACYIDVVRMQWMHLYCYFDEVKMQGTQIHTATMMQYECRGNQLRCYYDAVQMQGMQLQCYYDAVWMQGM